MRPRRITLRLVELTARSAIRRYRTLPRNDGPSQLIAFQERLDRTENASVNFDGDAWLRYVPVRLPDTIAVRDRLPPGAAAVLINRNHTYTDLYLPIDAREEELLTAVDGERTIAEICGRRSDLDLARAFFQQLWRWDQIVLDTSAAVVPS